MSAPRAKHRVAASRSAGGRAQRAGRDAGVPASRSSAPRPVGPGTAPKLQWSLREPGCPRRPRKKQTLITPGSAFTWAVGSRHPSPGLSGLVFELLWPPGVIHKPTHRHAPGISRSRAPQLLLQQQAGIAFSVPHHISSTGSAATPHPQVSKHVGAGVGHIPTVKQRGRPQPKKPDPIKTSPKVRSGA